MSSSVSSERDELIAAYQTLGVRVYGWSIPLVIGWAFTGTSKK